MKLYFAYGSNLLRSQMNERCPEHQFHSLASLADHRFLIGQRGYATIEPAPGDFVHGVIYRLSIADVTALDKYEGVVSGSYEKQYHSLRGLEGEIKNVLVYVDLRVQPGRPQEGYIENILSGASDFRLPMHYQEILRSFAQRK